MKSFTQFIKEVNTSVYGEVRVGSKSPEVTKKSISSGVDSAIKNLGTGKSGGSTVAKKGGYGLSGGVMHSTDESTVAGVNDGTVFGGWVNYSTGPVSVGYRLTENSAGSGTEKSLS